MPGSTSYEYKVARVGELQGFTAAGPGHPSVADQIEAVLNAPGNAGSGFEYYDSFVVPISIYVRPPVTNTTSKKGEVEELYFVFRRAL